MSSLLVDKILARQKVRVFPGADREHTPNDLVVKYQSVFEDLGDDVVVVVPGFSTSLHRVRSLEQLCECTPRIGGYISEVVRLPAALWSEIRLELKGVGIEDWGVHVAPQ